ncbi:oligopeptide/dipeptide ABC transporter ATP-binding protein [Desulfobaculum xiamenense]|uniref:Oligopeptide/dipeptide ABC transporter ATP-binding protein n=1 Tax=Desulfobaculum xiamenense TaxID=995050 RepID=A0A846QSD2_9BACT|nr:oligopeptide/dipeptide ABC transporter ATP-binding protein [Desulfobaculum xiamenense]NJB68084.1 oligopeptide/dipeptide ABC transporter ATP-binding protein [Desulfobaculum xiamenense]
MRAHQEPHRGPAQAAQGRTAIDDFIRIERLKKHYPVQGGPLGTTRGVVHAVDGMDLCVLRGETIGLVGESGCGKSTLARLLLRLERPTEGRILVDGQDIWQADHAFLKGYPHRMQMIFQDPFSSLNPRRSIGATVGEALAIHGMPRADRARRVSELLGLVGLRPEHAARYPHEFSGGQRQRVAIARALALNPDCVVCDEPVSALDVSIQAQVINLLQELQDRLNLTLVFISHDLAVVGYVSDRVAVMYLGRLMELADRQTLYAAPRHPYTRALLHAVPVPDPEARGGTERVGGDIPSPITPPPGCPFHPRCPQAVDTCSRSMPEWREVAPGHFVACHLA